MSEEEQGFKVKDRRIFSDDGQLREETSPDEAPAQEVPPAAQGDGPSSRSAGPLPPVDFGGLILSLSHAAMMHLGHIPDPLTGQPSPDPDLARHTIDTIAMLKDKTQGNLTVDEQRLIDHALTELRLAYVRQHG